MMNTKRTFSLDFNDCVSLFIAKSQQGKTTLITYLYSMIKNNYDAVFVVCPSNKYDKYWESILGREYVYDTYDPEWIRKLMDSVMNHGNRILLILDDIINDIEKTDSTLQELATMGSHLHGFSLFFVSQYIYKVAPVVRENAKYVFVSGVNSKSIDDFADNFRFRIDKKEFTYILNNNAGIDRQFVVINTRSLSNDINETYAIIKAPDEIVEYVNEINKNIVEASKQKRNIKNKN